MDSKSINIIIIIISSFIATLFSSCENDIKVVNKITSKDPSPVQTTTNMEAIYSDSAKVKFRLTSPLVRKHMGENPYLEFPKGIKVWFYDPNLNVTSSISANWALSHDKERYVEAKNDVVVINAKGEKLNTEHLFWDEKKEKITSDVFVKITTAREILIGDGLESDQTFTKYVIKKPKGSFSVNK
ncbi:MAG: LPS export ABC transporter periplasmic protein LptC [Bacteroidota bacterium]|nr:LPS export ABC transporter periplasmic protein LptC [Bacteroidota bacterium]